jgi:hypothetical protein
MDLVGVHFGRGLLLGLDLREHLDGPLDVVGVGPFTSGAAVHLGEELLQPASHQLELGVSFLEVQLGEGWKDGLALTASDVLEAIFADEELTEPDGKNLSRWKKKESTWAGVVTLHLELPGRAGGWLSTLYTPYSGHQLVVRGQVVLVLNLISSSSPAHNQEMACE